MKARTIAVIGALGAVAASLRRRRQTLPARPPALPTPAQPAALPAPDQEPGVTPLASVGGEAIEVDDTDLDAPEPDPELYLETDPDFEPDPPPAPRGGQPLASSAASPLVAAPPPEVPASGAPEGWEVVIPAPRRPEAVARLSGVSSIRRFFRTNDIPIWFVSPTAFNLLGIDRWVRRFTYVNYYDSFQGSHPNVLVPEHHPPQAFDSIEEINAHLLSHEQVIDRIRHDGGGKALFLLFDEKVEKLAREAGLEIAFPSADLRKRLDSKIETTRLGNDAGVPSVPNVLGRARSYEGLVSLARGADLGDDLVVQTPNGDSGQSTFFIASRADWDTHAERLVDEHLKVMKKITCREATVEGVITRHGTLVGPLLTELTGHPELTPFGGGWCGNDVSAAALTEQHRELARAYTKRMGERLRQEGYRGYFGVDFLAELDSGELYMDELSPRVTAASAMTNVTAVAHGSMPLILFHLLEFMDVDYEIDVEELNDAWSMPHTIDEWSLFILKDTTDKVELITEAPQSGIWRRDPAAHGGIRFVRPDTDWHTIETEDEAFYLRIAQAGGYRYPGADLGILVTRGRLQTDDHELTERAGEWNTGIKKQLWTAPLPPGQPPPVREPEPFGVKLL